MQCRCMDHGGNVSYVDGCEKCTTVTNTNDGKKTKMERLFGFDVALPLLKTGKRVQRDGWNGKGMWIAYQPGYPAGIPINANTAKATGLPEGTVCRFLPYVMMKTADGAFVPWLASQTDVLAEDWRVVD